MNTMLKYLIFLALLGCAKAEPIAEQDQIYIVAGVLGGVCLLLTIASIYNSVSFISLETRVKMLQNAGAAAAKAVQDVAAEAPPPRLEAHANPGYSHQDDNYNRPPPPRDNYRMDRIGQGGNYIYASDPTYQALYPTPYRGSRPAPQPRPAAARPDNRLEYY